MRHLVECTVYRAEFWNKVGNLMGRLGLDASTDTLKWIAGIRPDGKPATREEASVIFLAWRTRFVSFLTQLLARSTAPTSYMYTG